MGSVKTAQQPSAATPNFESVWAILQETARRQEETFRGIEELKESQKETDRQMKETDRIIKESQKETDRKMEKTARQIGKLGNRFGEMVEQLVAPNIEGKFNELGFMFTRTSTNVKIIDYETSKTSAEIDIFLENGDVAIAVEVKAKPNQDDVDEHVIRMEKLRRYADNRQDKRRYQGAVAGAVFSDSVRAYTLKKGFYIIEQTGDTVQINIPEGFKARDW